MKRTILSPADAAFLARTFDRNRALFGGWSMEEPDAAAQAAAAATAATATQATADAAAKATADAAAAAKGGDDKGFPANTPVVEMTVDQRAAYWQHQAQKHEGRNKDLLGITGGKYGDDLKTLLDDAEKVRQASLTDNQRAVEDAKREARESATSEFGPKSVRTAFDLLLGDMPEQERSDEIDLLDLSKFLTQNGDVDTAKVRAFAQKIAPADKGPGNQRHDFGAGRRTSGESKSGVGAGADMFNASRNKSTTNNS